jgi:hypothetical protein
VATNVRNIDLQNFTRCRLSGFTSQTVECEKCLMENDIPEPVRVRKVEYPATRRKLREDEMVHKLLIAPTLMTTTPH